jgi:hypothetical protein
VFDAHSDLSAIADLAHPGAALDRLEVQTVNEVARAGYARVVRHVTDELNLPASYVRGMFELRLAGGGRAEAEIRGRRQAVQLRRFDALKATVNGRAGVSVQVLKGGARKTVQGGFFAPLRAGTVAGGGGIGIFRRDKGSPRDQIHVLYGPEPGQVFARIAPDVSDELLAELAAKLDRGVAAFVVGAEDSLT